METKHAAPERLPALEVTEVGEYVMRNGERMVVDGITPAPTPYTFPVKGYYFSPTRRRVRSAWMRSGHADAVYSTRYDIVARVQ